MDWDKDKAVSWILKNCGEGWIPLVEEVYEKCPSNVTITDIYQKWGALRVDCSHWDDEFEEFLENIEEKSMETCEICGDSGDEKEIDGWIHTRCNRHSD